MIDKAKKALKTIRAILKLPKVKIRFSNFTDTTESKYKETFKYFTKLHRLKLFKNKTLSVALIDLNMYKSFDEYYKSINGKNSAAYYSRKALKREYKFIEIDRNDYIDDIYEINTSAEQRQGRSMSSGYLEKQKSYKNELNYRYFGVTDVHGKLLSYCNVGFYGEFILIVTLLGHKKYLNDGIMYLMMCELNKIAFNAYNKNGYKYIMYDTFFGASDGLKKFKEKLGYKSYKVEWLWGN
ncbi:MAG: hypothetical protein U9N59_10255 [Campylobacterota bacterium]|nr:hypothetical protein [Campylobacterota bacterium]